MKDELNPLYLNFSFRSYNSSEDKFLAEIALYGACGWKLQIYSGGSVMKVLKFNRKFCL